MSLSFFHVVSVQCFFSLSRPILTLLVQLFLFSRWCILFKCDECSRIRTKFPVGNEKVFHIYTFLFRKFDTPSLEWDFVRIFMHSTVSISPSLDSPKLGQRQDCLTEWSWMMCEQALMEQEKVTIFITKHNENLISFALKFKTSFDFNGTICWVYSNLRFIKSSGIYFSPIDESYK